LRDAPEASAEATGLEFLGTRPMRRSAARSPLDSPPPPPPPPPSFNAGAGGGELAAATGEPAVAVLPLLKSPESSAFPTALARLLSFPWGASPLGLRSPIQSKRGEAASSRVYSCCTTGSCLFLLDLFQVENTLLGVPGRCSPQLDAERTSRNSCSSLEETCGISRLADSCSPLGPLVLVLSM